MTTAEESAGGAAEAAATAASATHHQRGRVDAHHHFWDLQRREHAWITEDLAPLRRNFGPDDLRPLAAEHGVTATVAVQAEPYLTETLDLLAVASATPLVKAVVGWVDLEAGDLSAQLHQLSSAAGAALLRGVRYSLGASRDLRWLCGPAWQAAMTQLAAGGMVVELLARHFHLPAVVDAVRACPETSFVLDHAGLPPLREHAWAEWESGLTTLARESNVTCKLSGLITQCEWDGWRLEDVAPCAEVVLDAFGSDRVMFGSDWPVCLLAGSYQQVVRVAEHLTLGLSAHEYTAVWSDTARAVYRLGDP